MLPAGLAAHPDPSKGRVGTYPHGMLTVAELLVGGCSCDLVRARDPDPREDERHLRERYRRLGVPREQVIRALERHRLGALVRPPAIGWPRALAGFVAEHARNAGDTVYSLRFAADPRGADPRRGGGNSPPDPAPRRLTAAQVTSSPESWLAEGHPTLVVR